MPILEMGLASGRVAATPIRAQTPRASSANHLRSLRRRPPAWPGPHETGTVGAHGGPSLVFSCMLLYHYFARYEDLHFGEPGKELL